MSHYQLVKRFVRKFRQSAPRRPAFPSKEVCAMRLKLHLEECVKELDKAIKKGDMVKVFDSILDSLFVIIGTAIAFGISETQVDTGMGEVARSNMTKLWSLNELMEYDCETGDYEYTPTRNMETTGDRVKHLIVTNRDGKILKPLSYEPADLEWILDMKGGR